MILRLKYCLHFLLLMGLLSGCSIHQSGKYGYIDKTGKFVIQPQFGAVREFSEGLAPVGFAVDKDIVKAKLAKAQIDPSQGTVSFYKWGYIDKTGQLVIPAKFDQAHPFHYGRACVCMGTKIGYIDHAGKFVVPPQYEDDSSWGIGGDPEDSSDYHDFSEGLAAVPNSNLFRPDGWLNKSWGFIDKTGKTVIQPNYELPNIFSEKGSGVFHEGLAAVKY
jgi:hypothetical protein